MWRYYCLLVRHINNETNIMAKIEDTIAITFQAGSTSNINIQYCIAIAVFKRDHSDITYCCSLCLYSTTTTQCATFFCVIHTCMKYKQHISHTLPYFRTMCTPGIHSLNLKDNDGSLELVLVLCDSRQLLLNEVLFHPLPMYGDQLIDASVFSIFRTVKIIYSMKFFFPLCMEIKWCQCITIETMIQLNIFHQSIQI